MINKVYEMIKDLGIDITDKQKNQLEIYYNFLIEYNSHTNITGITEKEEVYLKHFYDSLLLSKCTNLSNTITLLDIGSGAGFPGMVLKIFYPNIRITLIDSNNKKVAFLNELANRLGLNVEIINDRVESLDKEMLNSFDIVTARAVAFIDIISSLAIPFVKKEGKILLMKGSFANEKKILDSHLKELNIKNYNIVNVSYLDNERNVIILEKEKPDDKVLEYSKIKKRNQKWSNI